MMTTEPQPRPKKRQAAPAAAPEPKKTKPTAEPPTMSTAAKPTTTAAPKKRAAAEPPAAEPPATAAEAAGADEQKARRLELNDKRVKLFAMARSSMTGDLLPGVAACNYPAINQFALAMEQMLQTRLRADLERLASPADAREGALRALRAAAAAAAEGATELLELVLRVADADRARQWPLRAPSTLDLLEAEATRTALVETGIDMVKALAGVDVMRPAHEQPLLPAYQLRVVADDLTVLAEVGFDYSAPTVVVTRDCTYQTLVHIAGLLATHPLFKVGSPEEAAALLARKREAARADLEQRTSLAAEGAVARFHTERAAVAARLQELRGAEPQRAADAAWAAVAALEAEVAATEAEVEKARHASQHSPYAGSDDAGKRKRWIELCALQQSFFGDELDHQRAELARQRASAEALRDAAASGQAQIAALELQLAEMDELKERVVDTPDGERRVIEQGLELVDAYIEQGLRPFVGWAGATAERLSALIKDWLALPAVLLEGHVAVYLRTHAMFEAAAARRA